MSAPPHLNPAVQFQQSASQDKPTNHWVNSIAFCRVGDSNNVHLFHLQENSKRVSMPVQLNKFSLSARGQSQTFRQNTNLLCPLLHVKKAFEKILQCSTIAANLSRRARERICSRVCRYVVCETRHLALLWSLCEVWSDLVLVNCRIVALRGQRVGPAICGWIWRSHFGGERPLA